MKNNWKTAKWNEMLFARRRRVKIVSMKYGETHETK